MSNRYRYDAKFQDYLFSSNEIKSIFLLSTFSQTTYNTTSPAPLARHPFFSFYKFSDKKIQTPHPLPPPPPPIFFQNWILYPQPTPSPSPPPPVGFFVNLSKSSLTCKPPPTIPIFFQIWILCPKYSLTPPPLTTFCFHS